MGKEEIGFHHIYFKRPSKQLDTTKTAIKYITRGLPAISVFESNDQNIISIGGVAEYNRYYNSSTNEWSTINTFGNYGVLHLHSEWAKYFRTLLDKDFNHSSDEIIPTVFDEIRSFEQTNEKKEIAKQLFLWNGNCMFGYYDKELQKYVILKFKE